MRWSRSNIPFPVFECKCWIKSGEDRPRYLHRHAQIFKCSDVSCSSMNVLVSTSVQLHVCKKRYGRAHNHSQLGAMMYQPLLQMNILAIMLYSDAQIPFVISAELGLRVDVRVLVGVNTRLDMFESLHQYLCVLVWFWCMADMVLVLWILHCVIGLLTRIHTVDMHVSLSYVDGKPSKFWAIPALG